MQHYKNKSQPDCRKVQTSTFSQGKPPLQKHNSTSAQHVEWSKLRWVYILQASMDTNPRVHSGGGVVPSKRFAQPLAKKKNPVRVDESLKNIFTILNG